MIRWKVVTENRKSSRVKNSHYTLTYKKGTTVTAKPNTLGIATFNNNKNAQHFRSEYDLEPSPLIVIKVKPIGVLIMEDEKGMDEKILAVPSIKTNSEYENISIILF